MLESGIRLRPNSGEVVAKIMDGEAILIDLSSGVYYSLDLAGGLVWQLIEEGSSLGEITEAVIARYDVEPGQADADVRQVVTELLDAGLVRVAPDPPAAAPPARPTALGARLPYEAPKLNAYHDMAELLALDPPHPGLTDTLSKPLE